MDLKNKQANPSFSSVKPQIKREPNRVKFLPEYVINQIKAGEVIDRPASLIKELIENSLDANSNQITLHLERCGLDLIIIEDNGVGIHFTDLPLSFQRHTTSKISGFEDLYHLKSYGFRGEALASIASIAKIECYSYYQSSSGEIAGGKIKLRGGEIDEIAPIPPNSISGKRVTGTKLYIRDLFFNTPVRLKFIRSKNSEKTILKRVLTSHLLHSPQVEFTIKWDQHESEHYPCSDEMNRIKDIFDLKKKVKHNINSVKKELIGPICGDYEFYRVKVYVVLTLNKLNRQSEQGFIFVNKRIVSDKGILKRVNYFFEHYLKMVLENHDNEMKASFHPIIYLEIPETEIDVNVHPHKVVVKFLNEKLVFSLVSSTLGNFFRKNPDLLTKIIFASTENESKVKPKVGIDLLPLKEMIEDHLVKDSVPFTDHNDFERSSITPVREIASPSKLTTLSTSKFLQEEINSPVDVLSKFYFKPSVIKNSSGFLISSYFNLNILWILELFSEMMIQDDRVVPLLIGRPIPLFFADYAKESDLEIKRKEEFIFSFLRSLGWHLERISKERVILKSYLEDVHEDYIESITILFFQLALKCLRNSDSDESDLTAPIFRQRLFKTLIDFLKQKESSLECNGEEFLFCKRVLSIEVYERLLSLKMDLSLPFQDHVQVEQLKRKEKIFFIPYF